MSAVATAPRHALLAGKTHAHVFAGTFLAAAGDTPALAIAVCGLLTDNVAPLETMPVCAVCTSKLRRARIEAKRARA